MLDDEPPVAVPYDAPPPPRLKKKNDDAEIANKYPPPYCAKSSDPACVNSYACACGDRASACTLVSNLNNVGFRKD
jgi:hypothetical protein